MTPFDYLLLTSTLVGVFFYAQNCKGDEVMKKKLEKMLSENVKFINAYKWLD